jgi:hypothetical protein
MNQFGSLSSIEILLSIVHYIVIISFIILISQIIWTLFSIYKEKQNMTIDENDMSE